ncbi:unnamed protein product [Alternaria alternata]
MVRMNGVQPSQRKGVRQKEGNNKRDSQGDATMARGMSTSRNSRSKSSLNNDTSSEADKEIIEEYDNDEADIEKGGAEEMSDEEPLEESQEERKRANQIREQEKDQANRNMSIDEEETAPIDIDDDSADSSDVSEQGLLDKIYANWKIRKLEEILRDGTRRTWLSGTTNIDDHEWNKETLHGFRKLSSLTKDNREGAKADIARRLQWRKHRANNEGTGKNRDVKEPRLRADLKAICADLKEKRKAEVDDEGDEELAGPKKKKPKTKGSSSKDDEDDADSTLDDFPIGTEIQNKEDRDVALIRICKNLGTTSLLEFLPAGLHPIGVNSDGDLDWRIVRKMLDFSNAVRTEAQRNMFKQELVDQVAEKTGLDSDMVCADIALAGEQFYREVRHAEPPTPNRTLRSYARPNPPLAASKSAETSQEPPMTPASGSYRSSSRRSQSRFLGPIQKQGATDQTRPVTKANSKSGSTSHQQPTQRAQQQGHTSFTSDLPEQQSYQTGRQAFSQAPVRPANESLPQALDLIYRNWNIASLRDIIPLRLIPAGVRSDADFDSTIVAGLVVLSNLTNTQERRTAARQEFENAIGWSSRPSVENVLSLIERIIARFRPTEQPESNIHERPLVQSPINQTLEEVAASNLGAQTRVEAAQETHRQRPLLPVYPRADTVAEPLATESGLRRALDELDTSDAEILVRQCRRRLAYFRSIGASTEEDEMQLEVAISLRDHATYSARTDYLLRHLQEQRRGARNGELATTGQGEQDMRGGDAEQEGRDSDGKENGDGDGGAVDGNAEGNGDK